MKHLVPIFFFLFCISTANAQQSIVFQHLNTANGLSYIGVNDMCTDLKGNIWIATGNGLNMFNGQSVEKYFHSEHPELQSSNVVHVTSDNSSQVWALTAGGYVTMLDKNRRLHRIGIYENNKWVRTRWVLNSQHGGIILLTVKGFYKYNPEINFLATDSLSKKHFNYLKVENFDTLLERGYRQVFYYDDDIYFFVNNEVFYKINFRTKKVEGKYSYPQRHLLIKWNKNELLQQNITNNEVELLNLATGEISFPFRDLTDQFNKKIEGALRFAEKIAPHKFVFTTTTAGMYIYDREKHKLYNYRHHAYDPNSILNNSTTTIGVGHRGWIFVTCNPNGISYFNANDIIGTKTVFVDDKGKSYDGYVAGIDTRDNDTYFIGTTEGLLQWKRSTNTSRFIDFTKPDGTPLFRNKELTCVVIDDYDNIWVTVQNDGLAVLDKNRNLRRHYRNEEGNPRSFKHKSVSRIKRGPDGYMWACGRTGLSRINTKTLEIDNLENTPLTRFDTVSISPLYIDEKYVWVSAPLRGLFMYDYRTGQLTEHLPFSKHKSEGGIFDMNADAEGNLYVANMRGLRIYYKDGREKVIRRKDGLLIDRAEGLLLDRNKRMWIGNDIGLACYNPADSSLRVFDGRYGMSIFGFRVGSYFQMANGEFFFGTPKGLQYFQPDSLYNKVINLNVSVSRIETKDIVSGITDDREFSLAASDNQVTFHFSSVDFSPHQNTFYEYKLVDLDKDWIRTDQNSVRYNSLPAGRYVFKVRVSNDNRTWQESGNEVAIVIAKKFYQTWWFRLLGVIVVLLLVWYVLKYYKRKQEIQREELETEVVINYFASRINSHQRTGDILWDVAKNCISKLNFEDCVIYLLDEEKNVLVQKAAWGPKAEKDFTIYQPIEIPVGKGIVGHVAKTGKPELISNTVLDERYIADDARRYSELSVPLIIDGKVIGVIDSEHSRKNFFTQKHLNIVSTIAVLCANQIQRAKAIEEKQQATIEALETKQKVTESRLQSLRLQMNPHFLFNALNSIQQMILANEEMVATRYLSRFSKLLRSILVHSDKEMVTLNEELEILNLYIELEAIRFKDSFKYKIICEDGIDRDELKVPTLLVQPFVENAIWHGLMHKEGNRELTVRFEDNDDFLQCTIEDNGIGREMADKTKLASGKDKKHTSKGISVSMERLKTLSNGHAKEELLQIIDLKDEAGRPAGTRVIINIPILN